MFLLLRRRCRRCRYARYLFCAIEFSSADALIFAAFFRARFADVLMRLSRRCMLAASLLPRCALRDFFFDVSDAASI